MNKEFKIFDCFCFFNEFDLLELRLQELKDIVDTFVIVESTRTLANKPRTLLLKDRLSEFESSNYNIKYIVFDDINLYNGYNPDPSKEDRHNLMFAQREYFKKGLSECSDDDIILFSDADEIPSSQAISHLITEELSNIENKPGIGLSTKYHYFYFNTPVCSTLSHSQFNGILAFKYKNFKTLDLKYARLNSHTYSSIPNGGWHFSYLADVEKIAKKIKASSHTEFTHFGENITHIQKCLESLSDIYGRGIRLTPIDLAHTVEPYPEYLLNNLDKYKKYIYDYEQQR